MTEQNGLVPDPARYYSALVADVGDASMVTTPEGVYRYVSPACQRRFGWLPEEMEGALEESFVHPDDLAPLQVLRSEVAPGEVTTATYRFRCRDGSYVWTEATSVLVKVEEGSVVVSTVRDIDDRHQSVVHLRQQALMDPLTGVANRTVLMDRLRHGLLRLDRRPGLLAVLYLDIDRFKGLNDSLGHRIGDGVLSKMAERVGQHLRPEDTLARLGGDEFVVVAEDLADEHSALVLANRLIRVVDEPFRVEDEEFTCTVSIGVACTSDARAAPEQVLREADLALYRAKDRGRNRAEMFDEDLRTEVVARRVTERMLRRAIDERRLVVEYQPVVELWNGRAVGAEALVRIGEVGAQLLLPASFIEVATETGLLMSVDKQVLADALHQARGWQDRLGPVGFAEIGINLNARNLADAGFPDHLIDQLDTHQIPYHHLQIEVTERVLMEASNSAMSALRALRDVGVRVGLDDFGTGYTSLSYLRLLPLDFVKIDRTLISDMDQERGGPAIVRAIIDFAHALGLFVVAEGVETTTQFEMLRALHCDRAQGFLFARSAPPAALDRFVLESSGPRGVFSPSRTADFGR
jgi:diguanylate cyclase (GGDEF)-like protein/PAS domain S-box-containing protein